jgi:LCP family protein required for cell wall assembly
MLRRHRRLGLLAATVTVVLAAIAGCTASHARPTATHASLLPSESPSAPAVASPSSGPLPGASIKGPLNILIVGVDTRVGVKDWQPHSDAVMVMHVSADHRDAYLFSLPRDLVVQIPAFRKAGFGGQTTKLTHAMSYGSAVPGSTHPNPAQGVQLLATTISRYTGIARFDAAAVLTFGGLIKLVNAMGGVDMNVDQKVVSIHRQPDGRPRITNPSADHGYSGPQAVYNPGMRHFVGWQAIDYARQRYIPGSDYARQRHQRQLIRAIIGKATSLKLITNPARLEGMASAMHEALIFDGRGQRVSDFAYALRGVPGNITLVTLRGGSVFSGSSYLGEALDGTSRGFFPAVRSDRCEAYLSAHRDLVGH